MFVNKFSMFVCFFVAVGDNDGTCLCSCLQGQEFTEQYMVEYQREDNGRWFQFHNRRGHEVSHRIMLTSPVRVIFNPKRIYVSQQFGFKQALSP